MSSVLVGRSVATVAELCAAQWALLLYRVARNANSRWGVVAWLLVPLIGIAEVSSWCGVPTTAYIGNAIEESIWARSSVLLIVGIAAVWRGCDPEVRRPLLVFAVACAAYVAFMCTVDVPMYVSRWVADQENGREYLTLGQGLLDAGSRWTVTHAWEEWRPEMPWMSLFFSAGVWCSLPLVHIPYLERRHSLRGDRLQAVMS